MVNRSLEREGWPAITESAENMAEVDERLARVLEHPDGWYWVAPDGHQQFGPFDTIEATLADMDATDSAPDSAVALAETERVLGLGDWIDPETGTLAEDAHVRLEEH